MNVYVISETDDDYTRIVAVYASREIADEHVTHMGGFLEECAVLGSLHPDAIDPEKQQAREAEAQEAKRRHEAYQEHWARSNKAAEEARPSPRMMLCCCQSFSERRMWTAHGYCRYCGGFAPEVFRQHLGEAALLAKIDELDLGRRRKLRAIVAAVTEPA